MNEPNLSDAPLCAELERMGGLSRRRPFRGSGQARATAMLAARRVKGTQGHRQRNIEKLIDFYYRPEIAAQVADYINDITPVVGAKEALVKDDPDVADNQLILASEETLANTHMFMALDTDRQKRYNGAFAKVSGA